MFPTSVRDPYARAGRFVVRSIEPTADGRFRAILDDSVLYPEGGGQPWDLGTVGGVAVLAVVRRPDGLEHTLAGPVSPGSVSVEVDWDRRFDHMQQHTGQHLLSALAADRFGLPTTSFHLHPGLDAVCDVELGGELELDRARALQDQVNEAIRAARAVRATVTDRLPPEARTRGVPDGVDAVRLIEIEGLDLNTCGGTHVRSTAELQQCVVLGVERLRGGTRVSFVFGERVARRLVVAERRLAAASALVSVGPSDLVDAIRRALDEAKAAAKSRSALADELAASIGAALAAGPGPLRALHRGDADLPFLNAVAAAAGRAAPDAVLWLTAGEGSEGAFLLVAPPERIGAVKGELLDRLGAKGGGPPGRLQGKASRIDRRDDVLALLAG
ncbi:MAG: alanyl-tRNA editing protein [Myxococcota bacterium]